MPVIRIALLYQPGKSHLDSLDDIIGLNKQCRYITERPQIEVVKGCISDFHIIQLTVKDEDEKFWRGFFSGKLFCTENRSITVGTDYQQNWGITPGDCQRLCMAKDDGGYSGGPVHVDFPEASVWIECEGKRLNLENINTAGKLKLLVEALNGTN